MITAGGTGGHVYPALAAAQAIHRQQPDAEICFAGTVGGFERPLVEESSVVFATHDEVYAGPLHGVNPIRLVSSLVKLCIGIVQAFRLLRIRKPQVILSTGGWASLSLTLAGRVLRIPVIIYLPDIEPGMTIKVLQRFATSIALTVPESSRFFPTGRTVVTGYPLRDSLREATRDRALDHFGLDAARKTLLVFGGSLGSRAVNIALGDILPDVLDAGFQVIHLTGKVDWEQSQARIGALKDHPHYHASMYCADMGMAFVVADLAVCRAGASILGEFPFFRLPSILIPLAYSWHYQQVNAAYLAERGAAVHLEEAELADKLWPTIQELFGDPERLEVMQSCVAKAGNPDGADRLARVLLELGRENT